jgi:hypothetical protein
LIAARMPTQAQEIDGHVLINDLGPVSEILPGDLVEVEITEALPHDVIGAVTKMVSPSRTREQTEAGALRASAVATGVEATAH